MVRHASGPVGGGRRNVRFIAVLLAVLLLVTYAPAIPMSLVNLFYR